MRRFAVAVAGVSLAGTALGCSAKGGSPAVEQEQSPVVNGQLSEARDNAVVSILADGAGCTGTLISPHVVLTALHCVTKYDSRIPFRCKPDGSLEPGSSGGVMGPLLEPPNIVSVRVGVQVGKSPVRAKALFGTGSTTACHDDIAVVVLESAPDIGDAPLVSLRFNATKRGERTRIVGYGSTLGTSVVNGRQERGRLSILGVGASETSGAGDAGLIARTIKVGEGPCQGDSGGPLFSEGTGAQLGVFSVILSNTCVGSDVQNIYTEVAPFESMIREAMATVGEEPLVEPPPATGVGGGGGAGATGEGGEPGLAGAPGEAGASGEAGAPSETGGSGGTTSRGGSGGSGAAAGTAADGTGGSGATGPTTPHGKGSGSRDDGSCALQTGGSPDAGSRSFVLFALAALSLSRRRRRRR